MPEIIKGSHLALIEGGPHGLNWTHAEQLNRELIDFMVQESSGAQRKVG